MNGKTTRYEGDSLSAIGGYGVRKRNVQLAFFDGQYPEVSQTTMSIREQTTAALERVADAAEAAGVGRDDVLRTTVYLTNTGRRDAVEEAYDAFFEDRRPAITIVGASSLPNGAAVGIEATGVRR